MASPGGAQAASSTPEQAQNIADALRYLEEKGVKKMLHTITQSLLIHRPEDPIVHMMDMLRGDAIKNGDLSTPRHFPLQYEALIYQLSTAENTADFVKIVEKSVIATTSASRVSVFFVDDDNEEVWAPPTQSAPELVCMDLGRGLPGRVAEIAADGKDARNHGVTMSNDIASCPLWRQEEGEGLNYVTKNFLIAPIMSVGKEPRPLGLIQAVNKAPAGGKDANAKCNFTPADVQFLEWLSGAAGRHLERLHLDVIFMKALLERDLNATTEDGEGLQDNDRTLMGEYYSSEVTGGALKRRNAKAGEEKSVKTVFKSLDTVATNIRFQRLGTMPSAGAFLNEWADASALTPDYADATQWRVDYWALNDRDEFRLLLCSLRMFDVFEELAVDIGTLYRFFSVIKKSYRVVPFHNFHHAMSTVHYAAKMAKVSKLEAVLTKSDLFAMVIATLCHDCEHRGYNNAFEMMTRSELALRYNDYSPLENHHCARAFELAVGNAAETGCNIFQDLKPEIYNLVRKRMVAGILSTDMKHHGHHVGLLRDFTLSEPSDSQSQFLVEVMVHAADISNPWMPPDISRRWCAFLNEEFTMQAQEEEKLGLPVTSFMVGLKDPQIGAKSLLGFMDFVINPLASALFKLLPDLQEPKEFLEQNRAYANAILHGTDPEEKSTGEPKVKPVKKLKDMLGQAVTPRSSVTQSSARTQVN